MNARHLRLSLAALAPLLATCVRPTAAPTPAPISPSASAAEAWRASPGDAAALALARAYFPELLAHDPSGGVAGAGASGKLQVKLPRRSDGALELNSRGRSFRVKFRDGAGGVPARFSEEAAFYGAEHFWMPVGGALAPSSGSAQVERIEEFILIPKETNEYRARYELSAPRDVVAVRDAGAYLELLDAGGQAVLRVHAPVARDGAGRSRAGTVRLGGTLKDGVAALDLSVDLRGMSAPILVDPGFSSTGTMASARSEHTATLLASGLVLVTGGLAGSYLLSAELYDPVTGMWSSTGSMTTARAGHTATLLPSGEVLVAGGRNAGGTLWSAELYDPATGLWSLTGSMASLRSGHTATLLASGEVLVTGGSNGTFVLSSAELYDSGARSWSLTGPMAVPRQFHTATLLPSGQVLVAGGGVSTAELFDRSTVSFNPTGSMLAIRSAHTATLLTSGQVLVTGGFNGAVAMSDVELYNPATGLWSPTVAMLRPRFQHVAVEIPTGQVLVAGGFTTAVVLGLADLYTPASGTWASAGPSMIDPRRQHTATVLSGGMVLLAGGANGLALASSELYDPANHMPIAAPLSKTLAEDTSASVTLSATDSDGDPLGYSVVAGPLHGALSAIPPNLIYIPSTDYSGADSFTYKASDGIVDSNVATVTLTVTPVNDAPVASDISSSRPEDTTQSITLAVTDVDGNPLTYSIVMGPSNGTLSGTAPSLVYTPNADYNGADSFTYKANDGTVDSAVALVTITVTPVNDAPVAKSGLVGSTAEDTPGTLTLEAADVDGNPLTYLVVTPPAHGTLSGSPPSLTYNPALNFNGADSFTFVANDGLINSSPATFALSVTPVNDPPVAQNVSVTTAGASIAVTLVASDVEGDPLTYSYSPPSHGTLTGTAPNLTYVPDSGFSGTDSFTYTANDGVDTSNTATVTVTVTEPPGPPKPPERPKPWVFECGGGGGGGCGGGGPGPGCNVAQGGTMLWLGWLGLSMLRRRWANARRRR